VSLPESKDGSLNLSKDVQESVGMSATWKIHLEYVYRMDREERLKQAYELVVPETIFNLCLDKEEEVTNEKPKNRAVCESVQQTTKSGTYD
jgi:hypothetical protein